MHTHGYDAEHLEEVFALALDGVREEGLGPGVVWQPEVESLGGLVVESREADNGFRWYRAAVALELHPSFVARNLIVNDVQDALGFSVRENLVDEFPDASLGLGAGEEPAGRDPDGLGERVKCVLHSANYFGLEVKEFLLYASRRLPDGSALAVKPTADLVDGVWTSIRFRERLRSLTVFHASAAGGPRPFGGSSSCRLSILYYNDKPKFNVLRLVPDFWWRRVYSRILANMAIRIKRHLLSLAMGPAPSGGPPLPEAPRGLRVPFASGSAAFPSIASSRRVGDLEAPPSPAAGALASAARAHVHAGGRDRESPFVLHSYSAGARAAHAHPANAALENVEEANGINSLYRRLVKDGYDPENAIDRELESAHVVALQEAARASLDLSLRLSGLSLAEGAPAKASRSPASAGGALAIGGTGAGGAAKTGCRPRPWAILDDGDGGEVDGPEGPRKLRPPFVSWGVPQLPQAGQLQEELSIGRPVQGSREHLHLHPLTAAAPAVPVTMLRASAGALAPAPDRAMKAEPAARAGSRSRSARKSDDDSKPAYLAVAQLRAARAPAKGSDVSDQRASVRVPEPPCTCTCHLLELQAAAAERLPGLRSLRPLVPKGAVAPVVNSSQLPATPSCTGGKCVCTANPQVHAPALVNKHSIPVPSLACTKVDGEVRSQGVGMQDAYGTAVYVFGPSPDDPSDVDAQSRAPPMAMGAAGASTSSSSSPTAATSGMTPAQSPPPGAAFVITQLAQAAQLCDTFFDNEPDPVDFTSVRLSSAVSAAKTKESGVMGCKNAKSAGKQAQAQAPPAAAQLNPAAASHAHGKTRTEAQNVFIGPSVAASHGAVAADPDGHVQQLATHQGHRSRGLPSDGAAGSKARGAAAVDIRSAPATGAGAGPGAGAFQRDPSEGLAPAEIEFAARALAKCREQRTVRIFLSSTFRDMQRERDVMNARVFPALRELCTSRGLFLVPADLRWGVTAEESAGGSVLTICLSELDRCQPYVVVTVGQRYGWSFAASPGDALLTATFDRLFYQRDAGWAAANVPEAERATFLPENAACEAKAKALVAEIAAAGYPIRPYPSPEALCDALLADLSGAIERDFPVEPEPGPLEAARAAHAAFLASRLRFYLARPALDRPLDAYAAAPADGTGLVVEGRSGLGKSSLIASFIRRVEGARRVVYHFVGGAANSADHAGVMRRLVAELHAAAGAPGEAAVPDEDDLRARPLFRGL
eukprot:tig00020723_g13461.t1